LALTAIAAVVIGRNEGERLDLSLRSVRDARLPMVYVDSGSTDGSPLLGERLGAHTVELSADRPFSAARARNEGLAEILRLWPDVEFVMFLDGDSTLDPHFPSAAVSAFGRYPHCAVVTGHLSERHPEASVYNRLCSIEWRSPPGVITDGRGLGGIMAARIAAFRAVGGFDEQAIAGEEAEFAARLESAHWSVLKIDEPMAIHDAQMLHFSQWWRRTLRSGHAMANRYFGTAGTNSEGRRHVKSALFWGFLLPLAALLLLISTRGISLLLLGGYAWLGRRTYRHYRASGLDRSDAWLATRFIIYGRFPEFLGIMRYGVNRLRGRFHVIDWR
jgi:glycosyltransferase involved in cell wall biosynthesis